MAKVEETKNELATTTAGTALSAEFMDDIIADAGAGTSQSADDNIVPFVVLLQDMSPEVKKRDAEYVQGAEVGMFLNKATKQLYAATPEQAKDAGFPELVFQHCSFDRAIIEWVPRNDGGGYVARHELVDGSPDKTMAKLGAKQVEDPNDPNKKNWKTADGKNDLIDTRYHFGHIVNADGTLSPAVIAFSSTGHTASREWMTAMNNVKIKHPTTGASLIAPSWSKKYAIHSKPAKNKKGDYFVATATDAGWITEKPLRDEGKRLHEAFSKGDVRADEGSSKPAENADKTAESVI